MFTFRFNCYRTFQYLLIYVFVSSEVIAGQTNKKCAEFNEYCLNHWDCCSNSCMSYLYRCTRGYNVYPYPFLGVSYKPTVTLDDILEQNFGGPNSISANQPKPYFESRFGDSDMAENTQVHIIIQNSEKANTESATTKNPIVLQETPVVLENRLGGEKNDTQQKENDINLQTTETSDSTSAAKPSCSEIGVKCYTNDECCTNRCHGYLHQCVT